MSEMDGHLGDLATFLCATSKQGKGAVESEAFPNADQYDKDEAISGPFGHQW